MMFLPKSRKLLGDTIFLRAAPRIELVQARLDRLPGEQHADLDHVAEDRRQDRDGDDRRQQIQGDLDGGVEHLSEGQVEGQRDGACGHQDQRGQVGLEHVARAQR